MKKLFQAIRQDDLETVRLLLAKKPDLIASTAKQPPKKDDGQSPLQVALKTSSFAIAELLLDLGADVNFMESPDCCNVWRAPVVHDAINQAIMHCRWNTCAPDGQVTVFHTRQEADRAFHLLQRILQAGADVNAADSYGNTGLWRFCLQAAQILPAWHHGERRILQDRLVTPELQEDLSRIWTLLCAYGLDRSSPNRHTGLTARERYTGQALEPFLI